MAVINLEKSWDYIVRHDTVCKNNYINVMQTPRVQRMTFNVGVGDKAVTDRKQVIPALFALELVTGQRPNITRARKSIDKFGLRRQMPIGARVTLRKKKMYNFLQEGESMNPLAPKKMPIMSEGSLRDLFLACGSDPEGHGGGVGWRAQKTTSRRRHAVAQPQGEAPFGLSDPVEENAWQEPAGAHQRSGMRSWPSEHDGPLADKAAAASGDACISKSHFVSDLRRTNQGDKKSLSPAKLAEGLHIFEGCKFLRAGTVGVKDFFVFKAVERQYSRFDTLYGMDVSIGTGDFDAFTPLAPPAVVVEDDAAAEAVAEGFAVSAGQAEAVAVGGAKPEPIESNMQPQTSLNFGHPTPLKQGEAEEKKKKAAQLVQAHIRKQSTHLFNNLLSAMALHTWRADVSTSGRLAGLRHSTPPSPVSANKNK